MTGSPVAPGGGRTTDYPDSLIRFTAWPPNWFRSAATAFMVGESSWRDRNRANSDAAITGHRDTEPDRLLDRPPAFTRIFGVAADLVEVRIFLQRLGQQLLQPGPHHRAVGPGLVDGLRVLDQILGRQQLVALGVRRHQRVLDAVVHHLGEMAGTDRAGVDESVLQLTGRAQGVEDRHRPRDVGVAAADHQAVAFLQAPDAAGDTRVDEGNSLFAQQFRVRTILGVARVAAVDDQVALGRAPRRGR